ncbi:MAG TPA: hypothetical protein VL425_07690 [Rudaea sp.]|nr:hypothetical protein [Rudaea sp.]
MGLIDVKESAVGRAYVARMDFSDPYLQILALGLALLMGTIALVNWLNRRHGGFLKGWAGMVFIAVCWIAALIFIALRVRS